MDSFDDLFPSTTAARPMGKFKPKSKSKPASVSSTVKPCTSATGPAHSTTSSSDTVSVVPLETPTCIEGNEIQQKGPESLGAEGTTISLGLELVDEVLLQTTNAATSELEPKANAVPEYEKHITSSIMPESTNLLSSPQNDPLHDSNTRLLHPIDYSFSESSLHHPTDSYLEIPITQDLENQSGAPHSESVFSVDDENSERGLGCSGAESVSVSSELEVLDDILVQPTATLGRALGKFQPKPHARPRNKKVVKLPSMFPEAVMPVPPVDSQPHGHHTDMSVKGITKLKASPGAVVEPTVALHCAPQSPAQTDPSPQLLPTLEPTSLMDDSHPEGAVTCENKDIQIEHGRLGREEQVGFSGLEALNDSVSQPTPAVQGVNEFHPEPIVEPNDTNSNAVLSLGTDIMQSVSPILGTEIHSPQIELSKGIPSGASAETFSINTQNSAPVETSPELLTNQDTVNSTGILHSEMISGDYDVVKKDCQSLREEQHCSQLGSQETEDHSRLANLEAEIGGCKEDLQNFPETSGIEDTKSRKRRNASISESSAGNVCFQKFKGTQDIQEEAPISTADPQKRQKKNKTIHTSIDKGKSVRNETHVSAAEENEAGPTRRLRKRTKHIPADEMEDGNYEPSYSSAMEEEHCESDYVCRVEDKTRKKRLPKAAKRSVKETNKPVQQHCKKVSEEPDTVKNAPNKKKFSHTTQRRRRTVSKVLLETPEEEIDPRKLTMKDLIMLAEFRERQSSKEAAAKRSFPTSSADNSLRNDAPYDNDDPFASNGGFEPDDDMADHREEPTPKLNYHSFMKKTPKERWSKSDTEMFYEALRQFGTDFAMIQQLFPGRSRHQVKLKFKAEERKHPLQLSDALVRRSKDLSHFRLLIERLRTEQNSTRDEESLDVSIGNEEDAMGSEQNDEVKKNEQSWEEMKKDPEDEFQKEKENKLDHEVESPVKSHDSPDVYDWSQYRSVDAFSPEDTGKGYYSIL